MGLFDRFQMAVRITGTAGRGSDALQVAERLLEEGMSLESLGLFKDALARYEAAIRLVPEMAKAHFNRGNLLLDRGDAASALQAYTKAVEHKPDSAALHYNIGNAHLRVGNAVAAITACRSAIALKPDFADAHVTLGVALGETGQHKEAVACYQRAVEIEPDSAEAHNHLAIALMKTKCFEEAVRSFDLALALKPDYAEAHHIRGIAHQDLGQFDKAILSYRQALAINPKSAEVHTNLGSALKELGQLDEAVASYKEALEINPELAEAHYNSGVALQKMGQIDNATVCYQRALKINPDHAPACNSLGAALGGLGQFENALVYFRLAIKLQPDSPDGHLNLGIALATLDQFDAAVGSFRRVLEIDADNVDAHVGLANALKDFGEFESALRCIQRALELDSDCVIAHNNLLFIQNYVADHPAALSFADAGRFGETVARLARPCTNWPNLPDPHRSLRVGFVSGDLCDHPVGYFLEGVLTALSSHASGRLELFAYPNRNCDDDTSKRIQANCKAWHPAVWLSDEKLAQRIKDDGIDILIDLSGHTAHNRLPVFAWKPAPVQVSWLGYFATTGVAAMDYFIADHWTLPPDQEAHFSEQVWRLPETRLCFTPPYADVAVSRLPALENGFVTFGSFNNLSKMNDAVVALWAQVLNEVPGSRLFLKYQQLAEASVRQLTCERFAVHGVAAGRLIFEDYVPRANYLASYQRVDIALDPFPFPGGTTTAEALWMGVPVLTLTGDRFLSRQGIGLLMNAGLPEWVATDKDDYVRRAVFHAGDLQRLALLRAGLRAQVLASPVFDAPRFAKHFEEALRGMWQKWCAAQLTSEITRSGEVYNGVVAPEKT